MPVDKQGILTIRPKVTAACNLRRYQSLAQPTLPTTLEQAVPPYKDRLYNTVLNSSMLAAEKVLKRVAAEVLSRRVAAEAPEEWGGEGIDSATTRVYVEL